MTNETTVPPEPVKVFVSAAGNLVMGLNDRQIVDCTNWQPTAMVKVQKLYEGREGLKRRIIESLTQVGMAGMIGDEPLNDLAEAEVEAILEATRRLPYGAVCTRSRHRWEIRVQPTADDRWKAEFPGHCETCLGEGGTQRRTTLLVCPDCLEQGKCPRCGERLDHDVPLQDDGNAPCVRCGWNWGNGANDMAPSR